MLWISLGSLCIYQQLRSFDTLLEMTAQIPVKTSVNVERHFSKIVLSDDERNAGLTIPGGVTVRVVSNEQKPLFVRFYAPNVEDGSELDYFCLKNSEQDEIRFRLVNSQNGKVYIPGDLLLQKEEVNKPFEMNVELDFVILPPPAGVDLSKNFKGKLGVSIHDL